MRFINIVFFEEHTKQKKRTNFGTSLGSSVIHSSEILPFCNLCNFTNSNRTPDPKTEKFSAMKQKALACELK